MKFLRKLLFRNSGSPPPSGDAPRPLETEDLKRLFVYRAPRYRLQDETKPGGKSGILNRRQSREIYPLSDHALQIWKRCKAPTPVSELLHSLSDQSAASPIEEGAILTALGDLRDKQIVYVSDSDFSADCAIIITVHNHIERFGIPCLLSVLEHSGKARIILYDNGSTDPSYPAVKALAESRPEVDYIRIEDQHAFGGLTGTWNDGIRRAREQGFEKVILLNHDVIVDDTWMAFLASIRSDHCIFGPLTNRPGNPGDPLPQQSRLPRFEGKRSVEALQGFCMGFTLGRPDLKLFDDWRFFNPDNPFGGNETDLQSRMKARSPEAAFYIVTDCWVRHDHNKGWTDKPRFPDPHADILDRKDYHLQRKTVLNNSSGDFVTRYGQYNISHCLRLEVLPLGAYDSAALAKSTLYVASDNIKWNKPEHKWRVYVLSNIFRRVEFVSADDLDRIVDPIPVDTSGGYHHHKFRKYPPNADAIRLTEFIKENAGLNRPDHPYVLLNQRPVNKRYLVEEKTDAPLGDYLAEALRKRGIPFKNCDFSEMTPNEQAQTCFGANLFISVHGAGLTNVIFTPRECPVLEFNFRKHWNCHPVCDRHFSGDLQDHEECDGELTFQPHFHKADFHNLCLLLGRPYTELEAERYGRHYSRNPINRVSVFVDGVRLLDEIEKRFSKS